MRGSVRVLTVLMENEYGDPGQGRSYDFYNLLLPLQDLYPGTLNFDFMQRARAVGPDAMNRELVSTVRRMTPDVTLFSLYSDLIRADTVDALRSHTTSVSYFFDDIWQRRYSAFWARHFDLVTTPDPGGVGRFAAEGLGNAIYAPLQYNERIYRRTSTDPDIDVSFVGQFHPYREWIVRRLRKAGILVTVFGHRWPNGRLSIDDMVDIFNRSKINLNISDSSHWDPRFLLTTPIALPWMLKIRKRHDYVNGRHFEIPGAGGFQLSYDVPWIDEFFDRGSEIAVYTSVDELIDKIRHYLGHEEERRAIADAGMRRAISDHAAGVRLPWLIGEILTRAGK